MKQYVVFSVDFCHLFQPLLGIVDGIEDARCIQGIRRCSRAYAPTRASSAILIEPYQAVPHTYRSFIKTLQPLLTDSSYSKCDEIAHHGGR